MRLLSTVWWERKKRFDAKCRNNSQVVLRKSFVNNSYGYSKVSSATEDEIFSSCLPCKLLLYAYWRPREQMPFRITHPKHLSRPGLSFQERITPAR